MLNRLRALGIKILLPLAMICFSGCGSGDDQSENVRGVTETEIVIGQWGPQTGPAALWGAVARGTDAYFKMINDEGGIHGRKIRYIYRDDAYQPARTKAVVKEMLEKDGVFAFVGGVGTAPGMAVKNYLHANKVPWVWPATGSSHFGFPPTKYLFAAYPLYCDEAAILIDYAVNTLDKKKIAFIYQNDDYGKGGLTGAELKLDNLGLKLVESAAVNPLDTDLSSYVLKLQESGAEIVVMYLLPKQAAILLGAAEKFSFQPQWMSSSTLSDVPLMYDVTKGLWKDVIIAAFGDLPDADTELMRKYREMHQKYAPDETWGTFFYSGVLFAEPLVAGLRAAGRDLTTESMVKAMESLRNFKGIGPHVTFGENIRQGSRSVFLAKCHSATDVEVLTGWLRSDIELEEAIRRLRL